MIITIKCELSEEWGELGEKKLNELADFLSEFFNGTCECFEVERGK